MSILTVKELAIALGLKMDDAAFAAADVAVSGLKKGLFAASAAFGGVVVGLAAMIKKTADVGSEAARTARQVQLTTAQVQGLRFAAASAANLGADELDGALKSLARSAYDASMHGGAAGHAFYRLGVQAFSSYGKARPLQQLLPELADRFSKMPDSIEKTAFATAIFGDAGVRLLPLLNKGPAAIAELTKEAVRFGVVMDEKTIAAAEGLNKTIRRVQASFDGLRNAVAGPFMKVLAPLLEQLANWIALNRQLIASKVVEFIAFVMRAAGGLYRAIKGVVALWEKLPALRGPLLILGAAVTALVAPWLAVAAAIALVLEDFYVFTQGGDSLIGRLLFAFEKIWDRFKKDPFGFIYEYAKKLFDWIVDQAAKVPERIKEALGSKAMQSVGVDPQGASVGDWIKDIAIRAGLLFPDGSFFRNPFAAASPPMLPAGGGVLAPQGGSSSNQFTINVNAGSGVDGKQVGLDIWSAIEPKVRELQASERAAAARALSR